MEVNQSKYEKFSRNQKRDIELVNRIKQGDEKAFEELVRIYYKPIFYTIKKIVGNDQDAEDLTNEVFIKVFYNIDMYNPFSSFSTWLFRVASNYSIDFLRKKKYNTTSLEENEEEGTNLGRTLKDDVLTPEEKIIQLQDLEELQKLLDLLPPDVKELIEMKYFKNMAYKDIAKKLKLPIGTVKAKLHRAKKLLSFLAKKHFKDLNQ